MLLASLLFSIMSVCVKFAAATHNVWEMVFWRSAIGLLVLLPLLRQMEGGLRAALATQHWPAHIVRNCAGVSALSGWYASLTLLPLATSTTLNTTSSLFIAVIVFVSAAWSGRARPSLWLLFSILAGFVGVVLLLRPTLAADQYLGAAIALVSGLLSAVAMMSVRALGRLGEPTSRIVFYFTGAGLAVAALGMALTGAKWPTLQSFPWLLGIGVTAIFGQLAVTRAYGRGRALLAANLSYVAIPLACLWGWLLFSDVLPLVAWLGMALIVASGAMATWLTAREEKPAGVSDT
jgi:S-adenosylmethionine uptake transporter